MLEYTTADGLLFVGDPHVSSRRPARRTDEDFLGVSLKKLARCMMMANRLNLVMVILGDLTDRSDDTHRRLMRGLIRIFKSAKHKVICMDGNHDAEDSVYADTGDQDFNEEMMDDTGGATILAMLDDAGLVHGVFSEGPVAVFTIGGERILLGASPYGKPIPAEVADAQAYDDVLWMTHHDLNFEGAYPGCIEPHAIKGCNLVMNGHMHRTMMPVEVPDQNGKVTHWFNPGNILRQSIKDREHEPAAWHWQPGMTLPRKILIEHEKDVFDLTGTRRFSVNPNVTGGEEFSSRFITLLQREESAEVSKTDGAEILREESKVLAEEMKLSEGATAEVETLFGSCFP